MILAEGSQSGCESPFPGSSNFDVSACFIVRNMISQSLRVHVTLSPHAGIEVAMNAGLS